MASRFLLLAKQAKTTVLVTIIGSNQKHVGQSSVLAQLEEVLHRQALKVVREHLMIIVKNQMKL